MVIKHWDDSFKVGDLLLYGIDLVDVLVEATALGLQLLHENSQPGGHVAEAFVLFGHSQIHLLQQLQVIVRPLTNQNSKFVSYFLLLFYGWALENVKWEGIWDQEKGIKRKGLDRERDCTWSSDLIMVETLVKRSLSDSASSSFSAMASLQTV